MTFSEMLEVLGISSSHLAYHLENLGELVSKTQNGKYKLSTFGEAAATTMSKVEETPKITEPKHLPSLPMKWKFFLAVLLFGLVVLAGISIIQYQYLNRMSAEYERLRELLDLIEKGASLRHEYTLEYKLEKFELEEGYRVHSFTSSFCLIYNLDENSALHLALSISTIPSEFQISINVQEGNAFDQRTNETAPVIWSVNTTTNGVYSVPLVSRGWYTISLFGPVKKWLDATGKVTGFLIPTPLGVDCLIDIRMVYEGEYSPFLVNSGPIR